MPEDAGAAPAAAGDEAPETLEAQYARAAKDTLDGEAERLVRKLLRAPRQRTRVVRLREGVDQVGYVCSVMAARLAALGYTEHPAEGEAGCYILRQHGEAEAEAYPFDLWVDVPEKPGLSGHYELLDDDDGGSDGEEEVSPAPTENNADADADAENPTEAAEDARASQRPRPPSLPLADGDWPVWKCLAREGAYLYSTKDGRWMIGDPAAEEEQGWVVAEEEHRAAPSSDAVMESPAALDAVYAAGMPQACVDWLCHTAQGWVKSRLAKVAYVPKDLYINHPTNPALTGRYRLGPFPVNGHPSWGHAAAPDVRLVSLPNSAGWLIGKVPPQYKLEQRPVVHDVVGWVCSLSEDSSVLPHRHEMGWLGYTGRGWAALPLGVARQRRAAPAGLLWRLLQSSDQHLAHGRKGLRDEVAARAGALVEAVLAVFETGARRGQTVYDETVAAVPPGNAAHDMHVLARAAAALADEHGLEGVGLELLTHDLLRLTYQLPYKSIDDALAEAVERIVRRRDVARPGEWVEEEVPLPLDALAEALEDAGVAEFSIAPSDAGSTVRVRRAWGARPLWDHGETAHLRYDVPDLKRRQHKALSPRRDALPAFFALGADAAVVPNRPPVQPPVLGAEFIALEAAARAASRSAPSQDSQAYRSITPVHTAPRVGSGSVDGLPRAAHGLRPAVQRVADAPPARISPPRHPSPLFDRPPSAEHLPPTRSSSLWDGEGGAAPPLGPGGGGERPFAAPMLPRRGVHPGPPRVHTLT
eukprot:TRINITY_DN18433_c0_g1_i1.p1 TRINITY_DN18433_c0_g1~~TRINITY_DN18433_c0_g1_i1.p1  ORF type:complete len:783 (+),score=230.92 TRINITY_DN18433_c0_g1_i1:80-2350(+)